MQALRQPKTDGCVANSSNQESDLRQIVPGNVTGQDNLSPTGGVNIE